MLLRKIKRRLKGEKMGELFCTFTYRNKDGKSCLSNRVSIAEAIERLHQYEDSGLSPNQVEAMVNKAEYKAPLTARWIRWGGERDYDWIKCENCHDYKIALKNKYPNFCENCGADMRLEDVFAPDRGCAVDASMRHAPEPPKSNPAPICQTCGNFETCPWRHEGVFSGPKDKARRVAACSDYKDTT